MTDRNEIVVRAQGYTIGGVRILVGLLWLANIHWKVPPDFGETGGGGLYKYSASVSRHSPLGLFTWVTEEIILPNFRFFGWFTLISEIALGALLLIGYRTRWVALAGAAMSIPIMLSVLYYDRADEWSWSYLLMIGVHLLLWAVAAGEHLGLDGVLRAVPGRSANALRIVGGITALVGLLGLFVARSVDFAGDHAKLLGSDAGFVNDDGSVTRRWELKFLWFNPLWALLTIVLGVLVFFAVKRLVLGWVAAGGLALLAVIVFFQQTFDYARDDGSLQTVSTGSNVAFWGGMALATALLVRRLSTQSPEVARDE